MEAVGYVVWGVCDSGVGGWRRSDTLTKKLFAGDYLIWFDAFSIFVSPRGVATRGRK